MLGYALIPNILPIGLLNKTPIFFFQYATKLVLKRSQILQSKK